MKEIIAQLKEVSFCPKCGECFLICDKCFKEIDIDEVAFCEGHGTHTCVKCFYKGWKK